MIYCDHNATTPVRPEVLEAMLPYLRDDFGNPSSVHALGSRARCAVEEARGAVAALLSADPAEIVFTSGGTESNHLALHGCLDGRPGTRLVTTAIEHASVLGPATEMRTRGVDVLELSPNAAGEIDPDAVVSALGTGCDLVTIGWANNEIGTVQPIAAIGVACRARGVALHTDAVQAVGKLPVCAGVADLLSLSAHKFGGPKGIGALYVRSGTRLTPTLLGGAQERGRRAGTENVAGIVGLGEACRLARQELLDEAANVAVLRDALWERLFVLSGVHRHGAASLTLPNTLNVRFDGVRGEALVAALDLRGIAVSSGSACAAGAGEPSHVLAALGVPPDLTRDGVRFSFGRGNTMADVETIATAVAELVLRMRGVRRGAGAT